MAIASKAAVESEYVTKRDVIIAYPAANLDADLVKLETMAATVLECLAVLRGREALNGRPTSTPEIEQIAEAAGQVGRTSALVRGYVAQVKTLLAAIAP